jgi:integrating conjugative element protein (TIGR03749 family)
MKHWILFMMIGLSLACTLYSQAETINAIAMPGDTGKHTEQLTPQRVLWNKHPIPLYIQRGHERIVHFPDDIRYWLPDTIKHKVTVLAANGVLYIQAHDSFTTTRIRVQGLTNQQIYLLDVSSGDVKAAGTDSYSDTLIVMEAKSVANQAKQRDAVRKPIDWKIRLTRFAAQQLYAPERLLTGDRSIQRIPVDTDSVALIRGGQFQASPVAAWKGGGLFVTAIKIRNLSQHDLQLTWLGSSTTNTILLSRQLRGRWLTATVQHHELHPAGNYADTTARDLISDRPFVESLEGVDHG